LYFSLRQYDIKLKSLYYSKKIEVGLKYDVDRILIVCVVFVTMLKCGIKILCR